MDVKPNLYASLDIIPVVGTNESKPQSNRTQNGLLHHQISSKGPNWSKTIESGSFQNFSINSKKFKNFHNI